ncbi:putative Olfactory receptor protein, partial [Naja naja]
MLFTGLFVYIRPPSNTSSDLELMFVVIYAILPPVLNPFIYTMRNKEFQNAFFLAAVLNTIGTFITPFCPNIINQFYYEIPPLLKLVCSDLYVIETG